MKAVTRREVLGDLGKGIMLLGLCPALVPQAGAALKWSRREGDELEFGGLEPLAALMQETPADALMPILVKKLNEGIEIRTLVAAGALANARTFGGENYNGYHAFMAMIPALEMSALLPVKQAPLPALKVLHRNARFMQESGGREHEVLRAIAPDGIPLRVDGRSVRQAMRDGDMARAEASFAGVARGTPAQAYDQLQTVIHDNVDVHRIVLAWRAWDMLRLVGDRHAHTMLRQSIRHCVDAETRRVSGGRAVPSLRELLPRLMEEHRLTQGAPGAEVPDDERIEQLADAIFGSDRDSAAELMAAALAEGFSPDHLGECLSLAGNKLLLHDPGRLRGEPGKPVGSVHGASVGVHASDAARAWRNVARVVGPSNRAASLIVGAYHTAGQSERVGMSPFADSTDDAVRREDSPEHLLPQLAEAVEAGDQARACAFVNHYEVAGGDPVLLFDTLLTYAISQDGALHAEKYFATVCQEFAEARPAFRWRHLVGLARVTASEYGFPAPGHEEAKALLGG